MSHLTLTVETGPTADVDAAARELLSMAARFEINVATKWNGHSVVARPGMSIADLHRDYALSVKLSNYPSS